MAQVELALRTMVIDALEDFVRVSGLSHRPITPEEITVELNLCPHRQPTTLPAGKMAVYAFFHQGRALKVGKVGPKSAARYTSQHYNPNSARSNLARSLLTGGDAMELRGFDAETIGSWIRLETDRVNFLMAASLGLPMLSLLEAFLHLRWQPVFEGRSPPD